MGANQSVIKNMKKATVNAKPRIENKPQEEKEEASTQPTMMGKETEEDNQAPYQSFVKAFIYHSSNSQMDFKENWGSKRMDSVNWNLKFVFEGENMDVYGSPSQFIKSVIVNEPHPKYGDDDYRIPGEIDEAQPASVRNIEKAPWVVSLPVTKKGYTVTGNVVTVNDEAFDFSLPINGMPPDFKLDIYCGEHSHDPHALATSMILELTVPRPILDTNSKTVYHMKGSYRYWSRKTDRDRHKELEFKITTPTGNPLKILSALATGKIATCSCTKTNTPGSFSLSFKVGDVEYSGKWNGDEFSGSFDNRDPDDFRPGRRHFNLPVTSTILKEDNPLNCLLDLPYGKLDIICSHIYQILLRGFDRKSHMPLPERPRDIAELLKEVGVSSENVESVVATLSHPIVQFNAIAEWTKEDPNSSGTTAEAIQKCFVWSDKKKNSYEPKLVKEMSKIFSSWEYQSTSTFERKKEFALKMKNEKKHFYNADRVFWLLVQQKCDIFRKMPKEIIKKIAYMLPPTLYGGLSFTCLYTEYGGCAGDSHYSLGIKLSLEETKKGRNCFIFSDNGAEENYYWRSENNYVIIYDPESSKFKKEAMKFEVLRDQRHGGVLLEWIESKFEHKDHSSLQFNKHLRRLEQSPADEFLARSKGERY